MEGKGEGMRRLAQANCLSMALLAMSALGCGDDDTSTRDAGDTEAQGSVAETEVRGDATVADLSDGEPGPDGAGELEVGERCTSDEQCVSEWCVPSAYGPICVPPCGSGCEAGWACVPASDNASDPVYLCVPVVVTDPPPVGDTTSPTDSSAPGDTAAAGDTDTSPGDTNHDDGGTPADSTPGDGSEAPDGIADIATDTGTPSDATPDAGPGPDTTVGDSDGDGFPDDVDNLPCLAIYLTVYNDGVTSASVQLNGAEIVGSSAFPTQDPITVFINPQSGTNTLALGGKLTGSPRDTLTLVVADTTGRIYFTTVIIRQPGSPTNNTFTFDLDATCP